MTLTNRLSLYFLTALAFVLAGFSTTLYFLASSHLHALSNQKLIAAMQTLVASAEVFPDHTEWEPLLRHITLGEDEAIDQVRWTVHSSDGRLRDCSLNWDKPLEGVPSPTDPGWRILASRMITGRFEPEPLKGWETPRLGWMNEPFPEAQVPGTVALPGDRTFTDKSMILVVGLVDWPTRATLNRLALWMGMVSLGVWTIAVLLGRWWCRHALYPVIRMATSARSLEGSQTKGITLDVAKTGDELEDLGIAFNRLLADLGETLDRQQRFTGDASHQLRTPVAAMMTMVDVGLRQERPAAEYQRILQAIQKRGNQLRQIIESLLFLARSENPNDLPEWQPLDLKEWCPQWLSTWDDHPRRKDLRLALPEASAWVSTHSALLGQVLDNLLDNACKYSEPGTPISIALTIRGDRVIMTVEDKGCGFDKEDCERIFEAFFRTEQSRWLGKPGAGLGLTLARRLVGFLDGTLWARSQKGIGSVFQVELPRDPLGPGQK